MSRIQSININGVIFNLNDVVSYTMENADPSSATGHIKKFNIDVDPNKSTISIGHSNSEEKTISINQPNLRLDPSSPSTRAPIKYLQKKTEKGVHFGEKFKVGETVSYFMAYSDPSPAIGKINKIEPKTGLLEIKHKEKEKEIIITININGAGHDVKHTSDAETPPPVKRDYVEKDSVKYYKDETIRYILKRDKEAALVALGPKASTADKLAAITTKYIVGKINKVDPDTNTLWIQHPDGSIKSINISSVIDKVSTKTDSGGSKKYTLEDENKYRLKYAKYKAKYLLLK